MKEKSRNLYCKIVSVLMVLLMVASVFACFGTMLKIDVGYLTPIDTFTSGRYTSGMSLTDVEVGVIPVIRFLKNIKVNGAVVWIQGREALISNLIGDGTKTLSESDLKQIAAYKQDIEDTRDSLTPEERESLSTLRYTEEFAKDMSLFYGFFSLFSSYQVNYPGLAGALVNISLIPSPVAIVMTIVVMVAVLIKAIMKLIALCNAKKKTDEELLESLCKNQVLDCIIAVFSIFLAVSVLFGQALTLGWGFIALLAIYLITLAIGSFNAIFLTEKIKPRYIIRHTMCIVTVVLCLCLAVCFVNFGANKSLFGDELDFTASYSGALLMDGVDANEIGNMVNSALNKAAITAVLPNYIAALLICFLLSMLVVVLAGDEYKMKIEKGKPSPTLPVLSILLLIAFIAPCILFTTPTLESREAAFEKGEYKILLDDYKVEGSLANTEYNNTIDLHEIEVEKLDGLTEAYNAAPEGEVKTALERQVFESKQKVAYLENVIDAQETNETAAVILGIVFSVLITALAFAMMFAVDPLAKLFDKGSDKPVTEEQK